MSSFFAFLNRMKYIERWSLMRSTVKENISEHTQQVAVIAHTLGVINKVVFDGDINADRVATMALYHEVGEVITGDLPTPIKYYNSTLSTAYKDLEKVANDKLIKTLPLELQSHYRELIEPDQNSYEWKLMKAADKISALIKCIDEAKSGNTEFSKAQISIQKEIGQFGYPEVEYFVEHFLDAYYLTLDELSE